MARKSKPRKSDAKQPSEYSEVDGKTGQYLGHFRQPRYFDEGHNELGTGGVPVYLGPYAYEDQEGVVHNNTAPNISSQPKAPAPTQGAGLP